MRSRIDTVVLVRYAEIGVKLGKSRRLFEDKLIRTIRCHLARFGLFPPLRLTPGRIFIETATFRIAMAAAAAAARTFGVHSAAPAYRIPNTLEELVSLIPELFGEWLESVSSFALRVRRVEAYPIKSRDIERIIGAEVKKTYTHLKVDLENPQVLIRIEIRSKRAYAYLDSWVYRGPGGLPYGVEGIAAIPIYKCSDEELFAAWLVARRGARLHFLTASKDCEILERFIGEWIPCGDAVIEATRRPWHKLARMAERGVALPVYPRIVMLPNGHYTVTPLELAPSEQIQRLYELYTAPPTPR